MSDENHYLNTHTSLASLASLVPVLGTSVGHTRAVGQMVIALAHLLVRHRLQALSYCLSPQ